MKSRVHTHLHFLRALHLLKPKFRKSLLKSCDESEINCICECIYNVLQGKVPLKEKEKSKLKKYKNILRKIVTRDRNNLRKNILIQKGGAFLPIILGSVLSALLNCFGK